MPAHRSGRAGPRRSGASSFAGLAILDRRPTAEEPAVDHMGLEHMGPSTCQPSTCQPTHASRAHASEHMPAEHMPAEHMPASTCQPSTCQPSTCQPSTCSRAHARRHQDEHCHYHAGLTAPAGASWGAGTDLPGRPFCPPPPRRAGAVTAICDSSPVVVGKVAERYGVLGFTDMSRFLDQDLTRARGTPDPPTWLWLFRRWARQARAGEKPLATQSKRLRNSRRAAELGLKLQVGAMKRHDPGVEYAARSSRDLVRSSRPGLVPRDVGLRPPTEHSVPRGTVVDETALGASSDYKQDRPALSVDTMERMSLTGSVSWSASSPACGRRWRARARTSPGTGPDGWRRRAVWRRSKFSASVHGLWAEGFDIYGETGHLRVRSFFPFFPPCQRGDRFHRGATRGAEPVLRHTDPYERQLEAFARSVLDDEPPFGRA